MKFGGTSVADENCIRRVVDILEESRRAGNELAAVVSAMGGVTDHLHAIAAEVIAGGESPPIEAFIQALRNRHLKTLASVAPDSFDEMTEIIDTEIAHLRTILTAVFNLKELTRRSNDYIISFGERLSMHILSAALRQRGIPSVALDGCDAGIITSPMHGNAMVLPESDTHIKTRILPLLADSVPVIAGYRGCTRDGVITTFGRSGSDYSAAVIGAAIDADEIWIWTDVDGVMTADPKIVENARVIPTVSYYEAMELSYFGAKVLHPRSIEPAMRSGIPVRVRNTFHPAHPGTCITKYEHADERVVKSIAYIEHVALININGAQMIGKPGVAKIIFSALAERMVNIRMISQGSSEANITLIVDDAHLTDAMEALSGCVKECIVREVTSDTDVVAMAVVGSGMIGTPGTGGRIFAALGKAGINVMMISQGSSEVNISFVVREEDGPRAIAVLHDEFRLSEEPDE